MTYHYIQINEDGIPIGNSWLSGKVEMDNMILVDDNTDWYGKKYEDGEWIDYEPVPDPMANVLSEADEMALEQAMNVQYLVDLAEINMEG